MPEPITVTMKDVIDKERDLDTELTAYSKAYYNYLATGKDQPDKTKLEAAITDVNNKLTDSSLPKHSNAEYDESYNKLKTDYSELVKMRNELDRKLADLYGAEDSVSNMYKSQLDSTIYASLLWSTLATTLIYYIFVKM